MANRGITIREVAQAAGVSTATVSRYLNDSGYVNDVTAARVRKAIRETGFTPSQMARGLKTRRTGMVLLVVPDVSNPFYARMAKAAQRLAREKGYVTLLADSDGEPERELAALDMADRMSVEGVLFATIDPNDEANRRICVASWAAVGLNAFPEGMAFDTVTVHRRGGTHLAVGHLAALGHRRIAFAGGKPGSFIAESRLEGYRSAMSAHGLSVREDWIVEKGFSQEDGYAAGRELARSKPLPSAVCCANDLIAIGVIRALNEAGLRVPEDVSVTGMDDIPFAEAVQPPLTTVTNDGELFAARAFEMLLERMDGEKIPARRVEIPNELVARGSTGAVL